MSTVLASALTGLAFGVVAVLLLLHPMIENKKSVMWSAFINRFAIGFLIGTVTLPVSSWMKGLGIGLLLSLPDAILTRAFVPVLAVGTVGGLIIGLIMA